MCALLRTLRERGHRVALRTLARGVATGLRLGFRAAPIDEHIESLEMTDWMAANGRQALRAAFDVFGMRAPLEVEDLREAIAVESPDALIVDPNTWGAAPMDEPVHVVATFPCGVPDGLALPTNACAAEFVPHGRVLDRAVCAITHGGMGVTQKALARGVPV
jgi:UDP:flavonoid glycosyltransferase YjiC (YdhE family)